MDKAFEDAIQHVGGNARSAVDYRHGDEGCAAVGDAGGFDPTVDPGGENFTAFDKRFVITCTIRS